MSKPETEMVERVARAVRAEKLRIEGPPGSGFDHSTMRVDERALARVAIMAMREPTEEMMAAVDCSGEKREWNSGQYWVRGYQLMIAAALGEP